MTTFTSRAGGQFRRFSIPVQALSLTLLILGNPLSAPSQEVYRVSGLGNTSGSKLTVEEARTVIKMHDTARAAVGIAKKMEWSNELAAYAQAWADKMAADGKFVHNPENKYGESIYWGFAQTHTVVDAVTSWESEKKDYNGGVFPEKDYGKIAHYTQMVWQDTTKLGMGKAFDAKNNRTYFVCNYDPRGNYFGRKPYAQAEATTIRVQFTNRTDKEVTFFLNGGKGLTSKLKAGESHSFTMQVDAGVPPIVGIFQPDEKRLNFTVADGKKYAFKVKGDRIENFFD